VGFRPLAWTDIQISLYRVRRRLARLRFPRFRSARDRLAPAAGDDGIRDVAHRIHAGL